MVELFSDEETKKDFKNKTIPDKIYKEEKSKKDDSDLDIDYIWYLDSDVICVSQIDNPSLNNKAIGSCLDSAHYTFNRVAHINEDYYFDAK